MRELQTLNRPGPSLYSLAKRVGVGFDDGNEAGADLFAYLRKMQIGCGINDIFQVNDCEDNTEFSESDTGTFDIAAAAATGKRVGTNCMKLSSTAACDGTQYVDTEYINQGAKPQKATDGSRQMDWRDTRYLGFWVFNNANGDFSTAGEMKVAIVSNNGTLSDKVNVQAIVDDVHQYMEIDMVAAGWDLANVESLRFYCSAAGSGEDLFIDDIIRYDISYGLGPLYGAMFPIKSGTAITDGAFVTWTVDGLIVSTSSAQVADIGPCKLFKNGQPVAAATGDAGRTVWAYVPGVYICILRSNGSCTAGDLLEWADATHVTDVTTTTTGLGFAIALETDGAAEDDIFVSIVKPGASA